MHCKQSPFLNCVPILFLKATYYSFFKFHEDKHVPYYLIIIIIEVKLNVNNPLCCAGGFFSFFAKDSVLLCVFLWFYGFWALVGLEDINKSFSR